MAFDEQKRENERRALEAVAAINSGANPAAEAFALSNEFTDRQTALLSLWLRRVFGRR